LATTVSPLDDFVRFSQRLALETRHAQDAYARGDFANTGLVAGFELEAWLIDENLFPVPRNVSFLARWPARWWCPSCRVSTSNSTAPRSLCALRALSLLENELVATWQQCLRVAALEESALIAIGTLPTIREADLSLASMSPYRRYAMLNEQILLLRGGRPLTLDIAGIDNLSTTHADVMLEAATTSFQVHLQTPASEAARTYNASLILAAPLLALSANSPFLFERALWHETRVPLFEQAVDCCDPGHPEHMRVTFGSGYLGADPTACFAENLSSYAVLLPVEIPRPVESYAHLRLHNGTIWRWNRLLIGFDDNELPHLRVEQRVMPAGPSIIDMIANAAFYYGAYACWRETGSWRRSRSCPSRSRATISTAPRGTVSVRNWSGSTDAACLPSSCWNASCCRWRALGLMRLELDAADVKRGTCR
jgi:hypothetical protein